MPTLWIAIVMLGGSAAAAVVLAIARAVAERGDAEEASLVRSALWAAPAVAAMVAVAALPSGWLLDLSVAASFVACIVGAAFEIRGDPLRRQIAFSVLYGGVLATSALYFERLGVLDGASGRATETFALAVGDYTSRVTLPATLFQPAAPLGAVLGTMTKHLGVLIAAGSFGFAAFGCASLAAEPLPRPGAGFLPLSRWWAVVLGVASCAAFISRGPFGSVATWLVAGLAPFFAVEGIALLARSLRALPSRHAMLIALGCACLFWPVLLFALVTIGALGEIARLRELTAFVAPAEAPVARPRLASALGAMATVAIAILGLGALDHEHERAETPWLGEASAVCRDGEITIAGADAARFSLEFAEFTIDLDESDDVAGACERRGRRACTADEWYLACLCTYPDDSLPGLRLSANHVLAHRVARDRPGSRYPKSPVRDLLGGRAERVAGSNIATLAGPATNREEPWAVDCRHRSRLGSETVTAGKLVATRCCR